MNIINDFTYLTPITFNVLFSECFFRCWWWCEIICDNFQPDLHHLKIQKKKTFSYIFLHIIHFYKNRWKFPTAVKTHDQRESVWLWPRFILGSKREKNTKKNYFACKHSRVDEALLLYIKIYFPHVEKKNETSEMRAI